MQNLGYKLLAVVIAVFLWGVAHGSTSTERGFDVPISLQGVPADLVIVDQSDDAVNVRVMGSRAALRNLELEKRDYGLDVSTAKPGEAVFELDQAALEGALELPRGARIVSRSPARVELRLEPLATKALRVRADVSGEPAPGFEITAIEVEPQRVRIAGARAEVGRLAEVATDPIDVTGSTAIVERDARLQLGGNHVWLEEGQPGAARVRVHVTPRPQPAPPPPPEPASPRRGRRR